MKITDILAVAGKPGLYQVLASGSASIVVESMVDGKRSSVPGTARVYHSDLKKLVQWYNLLVSKGGFPLEAPEKPEETAAEEAPKKEAKAEKKPAKKAAAKKQRRAAQ